MVRSKQWLRDCAFADGKRVPKKMDVGAGYLPAPAMRVVSEPRTGSPARGAY